MRRAAAKLDRHFAIPRGWTIFGLALASWGLVLMVVQLASTLFSYLASSI